VFLDAECVPPPGWLEPLLAHFADPSVGAVAPRIAPRAEPGTPGYLASYEDHHSPLDLGPRGSPVRPGSRVPYVPSAALAVRRAALEELDGFDESLRFGEDVDLVWRLAGQGWRVVYEPAVIVTHPARAGYRQWLSQRYRYGRSAADLAERHGRAVAPAACSPWSALGWALAAMGYPSAAAVFGVGTAVALARRAGPDRATARVLAGLALRGNLAAGRSLAEAVRRAWLPPALAGVVALRRSGSPSGRSASLAVLAAVAAEPIAEWISERPDVPVPVWAGMRLIDDAAYQAGVWAGVVAHRSPAALLPRW
jgi:mycofactocin system glycosyltransferase